MLDLEAITLRHLTEDKMEGKTFHEGHIVIDLFNCVREIERLRGEADPTIPDGMQNAVQRKCV